MTYFLSGGSKSGKSMLAQKIARSLPKPQYYLATMIPHDAEDHARIVRHLADRDGWGFETLECGTNILSISEDIRANGSFLLDSVTALLSNEMFRPDGSVDLSSPERIGKELIEFSRTAKNVIFVSDYIFADGNCYDELTAAYLKGLAQVCRTLAACSDHVAEVSAGQAIWYKGDWTE